MRSLILGCLLFFSLNSFGQDFDYKYNVNDLVGQSIAHFEAKTLNGHGFSSSQIKGKITMLIFWSKHCGGCNKELKDLSRIISEQDSSKFHIISIMDEKVEELRDKESRFEILDNDNGFYKYKNPIMGNTLIDFEIIPDGFQYRKLFRIPKTSPFILFIDENGIINNYSNSYYVWDNYDMLMKKLEPLIKI